MILEGITVLEIAGLAHSQACCKVLLDLGAKIIKINKTENAADYIEKLNRGKLSVALNLKSTKGCDILKQLCRKADVLVESFRYGVMEKLGLGPEDLMHENGRLVYTRLFGFEQNNTYADKEKLDNLSLSGFLAPTGNETPVLNVSPLSDFVGSGLLGALGVLLALLERQMSGVGQVVDEHFVRWSSYPISKITDTRDMVLIKSLNKGSPFSGGFYLNSIYKTKDGKKMAVSALQPHLYELLLVGLDIPPEECPYFCENGYKTLENKFLEKTQEEWVQVFKNLNARMTPVLSMDEAESGRAYDYTKRFREGNPLPVPEPRLSQSLPSTSKLLAPSSRGQHTLPVLQALGYTYQQICQFASEGIVYFPNASKL